MDNWPYLSWRYHANGPNGLCYTLYHYYNNTDEEEWNTMIIQCSSLAAKWELLSGYLGLPMKTIDRIKANRHGNGPGDEAMSVSKGLLRGLLILSPWCI